MAVLFLYYVLLLVLCSLGRSDAKADYEIVFEGVEVDKNPKHMIQTAFLRVGKFNQTANVVNYEGNFTQDLPPDATYTITAYEKMASNKYSMIPVKLYHGQACQIMETEKMIYPGIVAKGNWPTECPIKKGVYWLKDYIPDMSSTPDQLPGERWRVDLELSTRGQIHLKTSSFVYINRYI